MRGGRAGKEKRIVLNKGAYTVAKIKRGVRRALCDKLQNRLGVNRAGFVKKCLKKTGRDPRRKGGMRVTKSFQGKRSVLVLSLGQKNRRRIAP